MSSHTGASCYSSLTQEGHTLLCSDPWREEHAAAPGPNRMRESEGMEQVRKCYHQAAKRGGGGGDGCRAGMLQPGFPVAGEEVGGARTGSVFSGRASIKVKRGTE